jgi:hypothetical protein
MAIFRRDNKTIKVFCCYSHKDEGLRAEFETHLSMLKKEGIIDLWHDRRITGGKEWRGEIDEHLNSADIILFLISSDFLDSDYCMDVEVQRALERHKNGSARAIPIILRSCDWRRPPLSELQALPKDAIPVKKWPERDDAFLDIVEGIRKAVEEIAPTEDEQARPDPVPTELKPSITPEHRALLPYLCDRSSQEAVLKAALEKHEHLSHRPFVCIIHGDEQECHDMFLLRLQRITLPSLLNLKDGQILERSYPLEWPESYQERLDAFDLFRDKLANRLRCGSLASKEVMTRIIAREEKPLMIHSHLLTINWKHQGHKLTEAFLKLWNNWPDLPENRILICCLFIKYQRSDRRRFWEVPRFRRHNKEMKNFVAELDKGNFGSYENLRGVVLPQLEAILQNDADTWIHDHASQFSSAVDLDVWFMKVREIYEKSDRVSMEVLAQSLHELKEQKVKR